MKIDYHTPLQVIANSLKHYHDLTVKVEEPLAWTFSQATKLSMKMENQSMY